MHFMTKNNLEENISHFILIAPTKKIASKNCISNSWNSKIAFGEPGSRKFSCPGECYEGWCKKFQVCVTTAGNQKFPWL